MTELNLSAGHPARGGEPDPDTPEHLRPVRTDRGFSHLPPIPGFHAGQPAGNVRVFESSAATGPHVWIGAEQPEDRNNPVGSTFEAVIHMPLDHAVKFAEQIMWLAKHHYQIDTGQGG